MGYRRGYCQNLLGKVTDYSSSVDLSREKAQQKGRAEKCRWRDDEGYLQVYHFVALSPTLPLEEYNDETDWRRPVLIRVDHWKISIQSDRRDQRVAKDCEQRRKRVGIGLRWD